MTVSPRFRDIFSAKPLGARTSARHADASGREAISDAEFGRRADEVQIDLIWLEIAQAHRRAARAFTPGFLRLEDLATGEP